MEEKPPAAGSSTGPNYSLSGALAKDTNTFKGVVIKYNEPPEAHKPDQRWFLYPFKGDQSLDPIPIYRQSAYLLGRDRNIADIPIDHPSCSKQHAVIQFRKMKGKICPYLIDLESANKTKLNNETIEPSRYYQIFEKDVIKFGFSTRDYVIMHENCAIET
uniref:Smad nuclear interacting protein 1 n=1 Tax=Aceria tosichella TaxID=561515 RepID=A0A6G1SG58_9ACAR